MKIEGEMSSRTSNKSTEQHVTMLYETGDKTYNFIYVNI